MILINFSFGRLGNVVEFIFNGFGCERASHEEYGISVIEIMKMALGDSVLCLNQEC